MSLFLMPSLGADMEDATLVEWLVGPGDAVARGDVVAVVETQKGAIEVEIFATGRIVRLIASIGETLPVGAPLAEIEGEASPATEPEAPISPPTPAPSTSEPAPSRREAPASAAVLRASPAARRAAESAGVSLASLQGSGPGGAIVLADVEQAPDDARPASRRFETSDMRAAIAAAMTRSKRDVPHFYLFHAVDLQAAADWLAEVNAARPPADRLAMGLLLVRAAARAALKVPELNGTWSEAGFAVAKAVNVGLAVSLRGGGLVAPALRDADAGDLDDLMARMTDLVARARTGRLRASELTTPTLTVSSLGDRGVDAMLGVVFPPQAALVCFGTPAPRPAVVDGSVMPRLTVQASLSADHRVADGRLGARFLAALDAALQTPEAL